MENLYQKYLWGPHLTRLWLKQKKYLKKAKFLSLPQAGKVQRKVL